MSNPVNSYSKERIQGLDGLRGVSIILVLFGHGWYSLDFFSFLTPFQFFLSNASQGVLIFFVISGFLITQLLEQEKNNFKKVDLSGFYLRRFFRIIPALLCYLFAISILGFFKIINTSFYDLLTGLFFFQNYKHIFNFPTNDDYYYVGQLWTLSIEEQFYLFWPFLFVFMGRKVLIWLSLSVILFSPFIRILTYYLVPQWRPYIPIMAHTYFDPIMFGCLAALVKDFPLVTRFIFSKISPLGVLFSITFIFLIQPILVRDFGGPFNLTIGVFISSLLVSFILVYCYFRPDSILVKTLCFKPLVFVGIISYSLYLLNPLFLISAGSYIWQKFPYNFLLTFIFGIVSFFAVEKKFINLRKKLFY